MLRGQMVKAAKGHRKTIRAAITAAFRNYWKLKLRFGKQFLRALQANPLQYSAGVAADILEKCFQKTASRQRRNIDEIGDRDGLLPVAGEKMQAAHNRRMANLVGIHAGNLRFRFAARPSNFRQSRLEIRRSERRQIRSAELRPA